MLPIQIIPCFVFTRILTIQIYPRVSFIIMAFLNLK
ncbi:hypothetical protein PSYPI_18766 [Pseudomonas syringae pv. pisi str. 1704B]|uniref:Uncharacterized protein n=1 Tax=Pseudomonas syringae pv. pisi str. 1704B TaxID=629263 RepID=F3GB62_PSESJ|nr:hypothetical protein PSYPI_18766 [Pseudomonas syringae pv. pisi str. 1704B]